MNLLVPVFLLKIIFVLPLKMLFYTLDLLLVRRSCNFRLKLIGRIAMREALNLSYIQSFKDVINPAFDWLNGFFLKNSNEEEIFYECTDTDLKMLPNIKSLGEVNAKINWFRKPVDFNPKTDSIILYFHGGGFATKLIPSTLFFLQNLSRFFPRTAIVIQDYTTTASGKDTDKYPRQLIESVAAYSHLSQNVSCSNIILMGESAGGNLVLALLQYLIRRDINMPIKAVAISPWCNPMSYSDEELTLYKDCERIDSISFSGLKRFTELLHPTSSHFNPLDPLLNIEACFDEKTWKIILSQVDLLVTYGTEEILKHQIAKFINKLENIQCEKFNLANNVLLDEGGSHIEPALIISRDLSNWSRYKTVSRILAMLDRK
ncbi:hypothetical protein KAFR_0D01940 [Kazachstania africana CBS 2517]|uniref:Alpha/beta hydrolase fold-3 domain-containing protein n=1 Tax=Kazachstania africana (strain ATCC 22294 / BCRC 22015 / CBS 2517 / CECT 1963 / NBRC 1671 / NRRL Y-8276) TaxID=1071382 RepID=H2ATZ1_KAZAF|nr:hypothetical protein KAFR_0D01940 [Kazachstania africana CBS 2517]CCF57841.1 hypothetical protein KAFR_0D01940 [Kazachstania africana CBS 2517]